MRAARMACALGAAAVVVWAASALDKDEAFIGSRRNYWAFQKPVRPEVPDVKSAWVRTPVDAFILEALREKKLAPSREASREHLIRRLYLDVTGLPPGEPDEWTKLVDRLMASPQYGERWAEKWLDVVRYADTNGFELDQARPDAWRYRDYVVRSFNADKPFDRFIQEQIAGDELFPGDKEALLALGFLRAGPRHVVGGNTDEEQNRQDDLIEMTNSIGSSFLGMTVGCARCHNHKFDPILQSDYYRLQAVFAATDFTEKEIASADEAARYKAAHSAYEARMKPLKDEIEAIEKPYRERLRNEKAAKLDAEHLAAWKTPKAKRMGDQVRLAKEADGQVNLTWDEVVHALTPQDRDRRAGLRRRMHEIELYEPRPPAKAFAVENFEKKEAPQTWVLKVGDYKNKLDAVEPGFPRVLGGFSAPKEKAGRRSALAKWLASGDHTLTARVMVNRIWQFRMGTGLVGTPNDFGLLGGNPSNRKPLDWLATEFVASGWSVKHIDRLILLSSAYRQAADWDESKGAVDPGNKLYWKMNRRRLDAETLRDSLLAVSGVLNPQAGGPPVRVPIEKEIYDIIFTEGEPDNLWPLDPDKSQQYRRSLYLLNKRTVRLPMLANFDQPDDMTSCPNRPESTHALQALSLMNSDFMQEMAAAFALRLEGLCRDDVGCSVKEAYRLALGRGPAADEVRMARGFLSKGSMVDFCLAMLNRNEFVYVP